ncbi:unnamed protein product [Taenia asiatica]|uniref:Ovule protein n=1 Tax=Taenia asiatica TaxID=60517 RepID=A0A0R3VYE6_TAEAS|nr:unnamed protein product [Taenia asiatica]
MCKMLSWIHLKKIIYSKVEPNDEATSNEDLSSLPEESVARINSEGNLRQLSE